MTWMSLTARPGSDWCGPRPGPASGISAVDEAVEELWSFVPWTSPASPRVSVVVDGGLAVAEVVGVELVPPSAGPVPASEPPEAAFAGGADEPPHAAARNVRALRAATPARVVNRAEKEVVERAFPIAGKRTPIPEWPRRIAAKVLRFK